MTINAEKPSKGNFVVKIDGNPTPVLSLVGMARPFGKLKALDMDAVVADIRAAL